MIALTYIVGRAHKTGNASKNHISFFYYDAAFVFFHLGIGVFLLSLNLASKETFRCQNQASNKEDHLK